MTPKRPRIAAPSNDTGNEERNDPGNGETAEELRERMRQLGLRSAEKRRAAAASPPPPPEAPLNEAEALRRMMKVQESIALGNSKGATATQQTAAAKAWSELRLALLGIEEEAQSTRYDLSLLHDRYDLLDWVCSLDEEGLAEWREERAHARAEEEGEAPHPAEARDS